MESTLLVEEITQSVVDMSWRDAPTLAGFFQFQRHERSFSTNGVFRDCRVYAIRPTAMVGSFPGHFPGIPDATVFQDIFVQLMDILLDGGSSLYLHVKPLDPGPGYFDELSMMTRLTKQFGVRYSLLSPIAPKHPVDDVGNLIFECSRSLIPDVVENWFDSPFIEIDGYVMDGAELGKLVDAYFKPDSVETVRQVLSIVRQGFRLWPDLNGMYLFAERSLGELPAKIRALSV